MPGDHVADLVAAALARHGHEFVELDRRALRFAFVPGDFVTAVVRDQRTGEVLEISLDLEAETPVEVDELRARDRAASLAHPALSAALRDLLIRHGDLPRVEVVVSRWNGATYRWGGSVPAVVSLSDRAAVERVDLATDPEILDE